MEKYKTTFIMDLNDSKTLYKKRINGDIHCSIRTTYKLDK